MKIETERFVEVAAEELAKRHTRAHLEPIFRLIQQLRDAAMASFPDPAAAMALGAAIRAESVARMPELLEAFEAKATAAGAVVHWARDAEEANGIVLEIARQRGVSYVTKGKSMVTEEMGLNEVLARNGVEVFETDLGEFIIQLLGRPPFHIVGPAANIPVQEIRDLFLEKGVLQEPTTDPVELGRAARVFLREKFHHLEMGVTGVNMAVAETGTIINVENEGNIRMSKSSPRVQVSIMTLEKVVPTMGDAMHMLRLLCRNCTGQRIASYVSMDTGPKGPEDVDGPGELFIVILDNGRSRFYPDAELRQVLQCIRCGGCLLQCPVYGKIGGYPYGWAYSGPIGQVLNPLLLGFDRTRDLYRACTSCGVCKAVCPAGIDHPRLMLSYRRREVEEGRRPWAESKLMDLYTWGMERRWRWDLGIRALRPVLNLHARDRFISRMRGPAAGWFESRDLPALAKRPLRDSIGEGEGKTGPGDPGKK